MPMKFGTSIGIGYALAHVTLLALRHHVTQRSSSHWARTHAHIHTHAHYAIAKCVNVRFHTSRGSSRLRSPPERERGGASCCLPPASASLHRGFVICLESRRRQRPFPRSSFTRTLLFYDGRARDRILASWRNFSIMDTHFVRNAGQGFEACRRRRLRRSILEAEGRVSPRWSTVSCERPWRGPERHGGRLIRRHGRRPLRHSVPIVLPEVDRGSAADLAGRPMGAIQERGMRAAPASRRETA